MASTPPVPGARKAAILMVALGEQASKVIFPHLRDDEIQRVSREIASLERATSEEAEAVLQEFHAIALARSYMLEGGVEYAKKILRRSLPADRCRDILDRLVKYPDYGPGFANLRKADPKLLSKIIQKEHPQTIAFVLAHLDVSRAAQAIAGFSPELQVEVSRRLAGLEEISPDVAKKVSAVLDQKIGAMAGAAVEVQGVKTVAEILNRMGRKESRTILEKLEQEDPELAAHIRQLMFVFDDIRELPDRAVQEILRRADKQSLVVALKGASEALQEKFFRNMSSRAGETMREEMSFVGPVKLSEVSEAQSAITEVVRQLEEEGVISVGSAEEEDYIP